MAPRKAAPRPGHPVRGSTTGRPIMALLDLFGQRWVLRIIWELRDGPLTFRALQEACDGVSPSVLNARLKMLREALFVETTDAGYVLTPLGQELQAEFLPLTKWADKWADRIGKAGP
ncbi:MAG: helix-turn-helix domain-containing protein [Parvibaculaceae bacterium]